MAAVPFQIAQNEVKSVSNPARITAIGGDNATEFNLFFPDMNPGSQWVFPFTYGFMLVVDSPGYRPITVDASKTPVGGQTPPVTSKSANLVAYNTEQQFNPGLVSAGGSPALSPNKAPANINLQSGLGIGASLVIIPAVLGQRVYLFSLALSADAVAITQLELQDTAGTAIHSMRLGGSAIHTQVFYGAPLPIGLGVKIVNSAGAATTAMAGSVAYSQS